MGAINLVFLGGDLFNLYVALELLTFAAVPLVCLDGRARDARRRRCAICCSRCSVRCSTCSAPFCSTAPTARWTSLCWRSGPARAGDLVAAALMTVGLLAKTALFPLHLWLPPAHAGAPAAASAVLSALVVKGVVLSGGPALVRRDAAAAVTWRRRSSRGAGRGGDPGRQRPGAAAGAAEAADRLFDRRADRLSVPDVSARRRARVGAARAAASALAGGMLQAVSHAIAKAAMFMAAGLISGALGHDRIADLARRRPGVADDVCRVRDSAALSLIGLPPSGGFLAKWLLLTRGGRDRAMVVGAGDARRRPARRRLRVPGGVPRDGAGRRGWTLEAARAGAATPRDGRAGAGALFVAARSGRAGLGRVCFRSADPTSSEVAMPSVASARRSRCCSSLRWRSRRSLMLLACLSGGLRRRMPACLRSRRCRRSLAALFAGDGPPLDARQRASSR